MGVFANAELLKHDDYNVIGIVWHPLATFDNYFEAAENAGRVGRYAGEFLARLMSETGLTHESVYVVGHSLGAHGAGQVGRTVAKVTGKKLPRVTGEVEECLQRLSSSDCFGI